jgi:hypothetical protein
VRLFHANMLNASPAEVELYGNRVRLIVNGRERSSLELRPGVEADLILVKRPLGEANPVIGYELSGSGSTLRISYDEGWALKDIDAFLDPLLHVVQERRLKHGRGLVSYLRDTRGPGGTGPVRQIRDD